MERFYEQLDRDERQFRLLRLLYRAGDPALNFEVAAFSLDNAPDYVALSYCCGQEPANCCIIVNCRVFFVRRNLYKYLELINSEDDCRWHFVDAVCIDQSDDVERGYQVGLMGEIYPNASLVVAWLGYESPVHKWDERLWSMFETLTAILHNDGQCTAITLGQELEQAYPALPLLLWCRMVDFHDSDYWNRLWIVQELTLARALISRYKTLSVEPLTLLNYAEAAYASIGHEAIAGEASDPFVGMLSNNDLIGKWRTILKSSRSMHHLATKCGIPFHKAIITFWLQDCSRRHDMIFGLLAMTRSRMTANYRMTPLELYVGALVEGLVEINYYRSPRTRRKEVHHFIMCLLSALELDFSHPTVLLCTEQVFQRLDHEVWPGLYQSVQEVRTSDDHECHKLYPKWPMPTLVSWRMKVTWRQLRIAERKDAYLSVPHTKGQGRLRYSACLDMVDRLRDSVIEEGLSPSLEEEWKMVKKPLGIIWHQ